MHIYIINNIKYKQGCHGKKGKPIFGLYLIRYPGHRLKKTSLFHIVDLHIVD